MRIHVIIGAMAGLMLAAGGPAQAAGRGRAVAELRDADGAPRGKVTIAETADGLSLRASVTGLPAGPKGIHVHTVGRCDGPDFTTAGGHWNPAGHQHGMENPAGSHMGDLRNVAVAGGGKGKLNAAIAGGRLTEGPSPLLDADGAAVVVHAGPDDYKTDPAGNSGKRIACGVIVAR